MRLCQACIFNILVDVVLSGWFVWKFAWCVVRLVRQFETLLCFCHERLLETLLCFCHERLLETLLCFCHERLLETLLCFCHERLLETLLCFCHERLLETLLCFCHERLLETLLCFCHERLLETLLCFCHERLLETLLCFCHERLLETLLCFCHERLLETLLGVFLSCLFATVFVCLSHLFKPCLLFFHHFLNFIRCVCTMLVCLKPSLMRPCRPGFLCFGPLAVSWPMSVPVLDFKKIRN